MRLPVQIIQLGNPEAIDTKNVKPLAILVSFVIHWLSVELGTNLLSSFMIIFSKFHNFDNSYLCKSSQLLKCIICNANTPVSVANMYPYVKINYTILLNVVIR